jgi:hypothetical protein
VQALVFLQALDNQALVQALVLQGVGNQVHQEDQGS